MSRNIVTPKSVSFEDALRNLASRLTGQPAAKLPRTQEGIVQFMAENIPTADELAESVTQEVMARLVESSGANPAVTEPAQGPEDGVEAAGDTSTPSAAEPHRDVPQTATETPIPKASRKTTKAKNDK